MIVCIFDTETTGLIENHMRKLDQQPEVIEFAGVLADWDLLNVKEQYESFVRPSQALPDKTREVTHLSDDDLKSAPVFRDIADRVQGLIAGADIVCGHNLSYDMEIIDLEFERLGRTFVWPTTRICTVEQTIHISGNRIKLSDLYRMLTGQEHRDAHRAMPDVLATLVCLKGIRDKGWL